MEKPTIQIRVPEEGKGVISPRLFGTNLEHTRGSLCGGLSAQMLKNRKFAGSPSAMEGMASCWYRIGEMAYVFLGTPYTRHHEQYHMRRRMEQNSQGIMNMTAGQVCGVGQHGVYLEAGKTYELAMVLRSDRDLDLSVQFTDHYGKTTYAQITWSLQKGDEWTRFTALVTPSAGDPDADLRITFDAVGSVDIGCVSLLPQGHFRGMRRDVVDCLKDMGIRVLRWPGGNFAGEYNWFDGLLPVDERSPLESYLAMKTQPYSLGYDFHEINTDDFVALCREIGAEPYITINPAWNTPEESAAWVEYCNGDESTTYGKLRIERGFDEPYRVKLWSLGNEIGHGHMEGDNTPDGYARMARKNAEAMLAVSPDLELCSSGPHPNGDWVEKTVKPLTDMVPLVSLHWYEFIGENVCAYYGRLDGMEALYDRVVDNVGSIRDLSRCMRRTLGDLPVQIAFDEWNIWHAWWRPSCVIDGIYTAGVFHTLIGGADECGIGIACQFELINESGIKVTPTEAIPSATARAFSIMKHHCGGTLRYATDEVVASERDGIMTVTLINFSRNETVSYCLDGMGALVEATLYEGKSILPYSDFEPCALAVEDGRLEIPAHSVARVRYQTK